MNFEITSGECGKDFLLFYYFLILEDLALRSGKRAKRAAQLNVVSYF